LLQEFKGHAFGIGELDTCEGSVTVLNKIREDDIGLVREVHKLWNWLRDSEGNLEKRRLPSSQELPTELFELIKINSRLPIILLGILDDLLFFSLAFILVLCSILVSKST
jgi:hypothetical protein